MLVELLPHLLRFNPVQICAVGYKLLIIKDL